VELVLGFCPHLLVSLCITSWDVCSIVISVRCNAPAVNCSKFLYVFIADFSYRALGCDGVQFLGGHMVDHYVKSEAVRGTTAL
jgi:hypothetical protein